MSGSQYGVMALKPKFQSTRGRHDIRVFAEFRLHTSMPVIRRGNQVALKETQLDFEMYNPLALKTLKTIEANDCVWVKYYPVGRYSKMGVIYTVLTATWIELIVRHEQLQNARDVAESVSGYKEGGTEAQAAEIVRLTRRLEETETKLEASQQYNRTLVERNGFRLKTKDKPPA